MTPGTRVKMNTCYRVMTRGINKSFDKLFILWLPSKDKFHSTTIKSSNSVHKALC